MKRATKKTGRTPEFPQGIDAASGGQVKSLFKDNQAVHDRIHNPLQEKSEHANSGDAGGGDQ